MARDARPNTPRWTSTSRSDGCTRGQRERLGRADAHGGRAPAAAQLEGRQVRRPALGDDLAAAPAEGRLERHGGRAGPRAAAGGDAVGEVADLDRRGGAARLAQRERAGDVAGHVVEAHRRQQPHAGPLRARAVALEDVAQERRLAGRVDVVGPRGERGLDGGLAEAHEGPDRADEHVALADERADRGRVPDVGHARLEAAEVGRERLQALARPRGEDRARAALHEGAGGQLPGVARRAEEHDLRSHGAEHIPGAGPGRVRSARRPILPGVDERVLAERLMSYDTSQPEGLGAAAAFVKGWLESREVAVEQRSFDGLPVILADVGPRDAPTVILHGHLDVVPAREGQFTPRVEGDRLIGRGAYDMKGALAVLLCATVDAAAQDRVRVRLLCVPDEESEDVTRRSTDALVAEGLRADFALTGEPTDLHIGVQAKGVLAVRVEVQGHERPRLDPVARRQRDPQGPRRLPPHRDPALQPRVLGPLRPAVDQPRAHRGRRRLQQGPRRLHDGRRHPLPAQPGPGRDPRPDPGHRRPRDRQAVHPRAGDRLAPQPVRAGAARRGRALDRGRRAVRRPRRRLGRDLVPGGRHPGRRVRARSAAATTARTSGSRSPRWRATARRCATSSSPCPSGSPPHEDAAAARHRGRPGVRLPFRHRLPPEERPPHPGRSMLARAALGALLICVLTDRLGRVRGPARGQRRGPDLPAREQAAGPGRQGAPRRRRAGQAPDDPRHRRRPPLRRGLRPQGQAAQAPGAARSDTMMLMRLDPSKGATAIMSLPRDLRSDIPGHGARQAQRGLRLRRGQADASRRSAACSASRSTTRPRHLLGLPRRGRPARLRLQRRRPPLLPLERRPRRRRQQYAEIDVKAGYQKLCGQKALDYVRFRHTDTDLVRAARQQDFLRDAKEPGRRRQPLPRPHAAPADLRPSVRTDIRSTRAILGLLKLVAESSGKPIQPVRLQVTDATDGSGDVEATPSAIRAARAALPRRPGQPEGDRDAPHRPQGEAPRRTPPGHRDGAVRPLRQRRPGRGRSRPGSRSSCGARLPVYYPEARDGSGSYQTTDSRSYTIRDRVGQAAQGLPDRGLRGPRRPVLRRPGHDLAVPADPRRPVRDPDACAAAGYELYYDGNRLRLVAWRTGKAWYWVSNTLLGSLSKKQMLAMARSLTRVGS